MAILISPTRSKTRIDSRRAIRRPLVVHGRISWKDQRGATRIANVITRNVSADAVYVEWREVSSIPLYRLVHFQVTPEARHNSNLPEPLRIGKVMSAVFRVGARRPSTGTPEGYALRLLVDPVRRAADQSVDQTEIVSATAIA